ncbi:dehydrogenase [Xanthomonas nasturtii]|uniref:Dehydrogenase n=1 Tax=Xanthomonas nasturtii TaxID=1843581 RepID=A0ABT0LQS1_9XANT|nr:dehydrogenase [Xanthomonas nasturtii]MCL1551664.1 dehydrogenase [Xanthomonas nasturtii]MCL1556009.1 dehydrogenase [Xanthomonas nasturtii]
MVGIPTGSGQFKNAPAALLGEPEFYLQRPGFWHGGAGIAACWYGAATAIAEHLRRSPRVMHNPFSAAHLGAIDAQLLAARLMLHDLATTIDSAPTESHQFAVIQLRSLMDRICRDVIERAALALGPVSLCCDAEHAQRCADLAAFIRQSHAEKDEQWLGEQLSAREATPWQL